MKIPIEIHLSSFLEPNFPFLYYHYKHFLDRSRKLLEIRLAIDVLAIEYHRATSFEEEKKKKKKKRKTRKKERRKKRRRRRRRRRIEMTSISRGGGSNQRDVISARIGWSMVDRPSHRSPAISRHRASMAAVSLPVSERRHSRDTEWFPRWRNANTLMMLLVSYV